MKASDISEIDTDELLLLHYIHMPLRVVLVKPNKTQSKIQVKQNEVKSGIRP